MTPGEVVFAVLAVQVATYVVLGGLFLVAGQWRLGVAQLCLALVQALVFGGGS